MWDSGTNGVKYNNHNNKVSHQSVPLPGRTGHFGTLGHGTKLGRAFSPEFLIHQRKDRRSDAHHNERCDGTPDGVRLGKFPDREDAQDRAGDERDRDHAERDPAYELRVQYTAAFGLEFDHNVRVFVRHVKIITNR